MRTLSESIIGSNDAGILDKINKWVDDNFFITSQKPTFKITPKGLVMSGTLDIKSPYTEPFPYKPHNIKIIPDKSLKIHIYGEDNIKKWNLSELLDDSVPFALSLEYIGKLPQWVYDLNLSRLTIGTSVDVDGDNLSKIDKKTILQFNVSSARDLIKSLIKHDNVVVK